LDIFSLFLNGTPLEQFPIEPNQKRGDIMKLVRFFLSLMILCNLQLGFTQLHQDSPEVRNKNVQHDFFKTVELDSNGVVVIDASLYINGNTTTKVLTITGGADLAEPFKITGNKSTKKGSVVVIDRDNPGALKLSYKAYDSCVAGVVSGAGGVNPGLTLQQNGKIDEGIAVALTGRVYVWASSNNGSIQPGDLLTTSDIPGYAMKATDRELSNGSILGKAMTSLNNNEGLILVLVNLQ
jgi:hypothetical protein